jgi:hypothetical protein
MRITSRLDLLNCSSGVENWRRGVTCRNCDPPGARRSRRTEPLFTRAVANLRPVLLFRDSQFSVCLAKRVHLVTVLVRRNVESKGSHGIYVSHASGGEVDRESARHAVCNSMLAPGVCAGSFPLRKFPFAGTRQSYSSSKRSCRKWCGLHSCGSD